MMKRFNNRKYILITLVAVLVAVVALVIGIINSNDSPIDKSYFVSDDTKLVMSLNKDIAAFEEGVYEPDVTHVVYYYSGDKITGERVYFEYNTEEEAKEAFDNININEKDWAVTKKLNGRYIWFEAVKARYDGLKKEQVEKNIENMREAGGLAEEVEADENADEDETEEVTEEVNEDGFRASEVLEDAEVQE